MPDIPTRLDLYARGRDYIEQHSSKLDPGVVDVEGSDANVIVGSASVMAALVAKQAGYQSARHFYDGCSGEDLDRKVIDDIQEPRKGASPALTQVRFFRASAAAGLGTISAGTKVVSLTGIEFVTTSSATFGAATLEALADARSSEAGAATKVGANAIRKIDKPSALFDPSIEVTNDERSAGGEDAESDDDYRARARGFWSAARRGVLGAIEYGALRVDGVTSAMAVEVVTPDGSPGRVVELYLADSAGVSNAQIGVLVDAELREWKAGGIFVAKKFSTPTIVSVELRLAFYAGVDQGALTELVRNAVVTFVNSLGVNQPLYLAELRAVLARFKQDGLVPSDQSVASPAGDVVPPTGSTLRTRLANVTVA